MNGNIHSFQSLGTVDGPGVRFVVFLHGCNLHCGYCHNIDVCRGEYKVMRPEEVFEKIIRYKAYFGTQGGVTVSGGEPLLQPEFVQELFALCKKAGIHTALDTAGSLWNEQISQLLSYCDLVLLDIKMTNEEDYQKHIGCEMDAPLFFLDQLEKRNIPCYIRHVVVGGLNDTEENIDRLWELVSSKTCVKKIELLPFKKICTQKYEALHIPFPFARFHEPTKDVMTKLNQRIEKI